MTCSSKEWKIAATFFCCVLHTTILMGQDLSIQEVEPFIDDMSVGDHIKLGEYTFMLASEHVSNTSGMMYKYLQQTWHKVPIDGMIVTLAKRPDKGIDVYGSRMVLKEEWDPQEVSWPNPEVLTRSVLQKLMPSRAKIGESILAAPTWHRQGDSWVQAYSIRYHDAQSHWKVVVGLDGEVIDKIDLVLRCSHGNFHTACRQHPTTSLPELQVLAAEQSYRVYPLGTTGPQSSTQELVVNPADPLASPYGWHDTSATMSPDFTDTRGNNAFVQEDRSGTNSAGIRPSRNIDLQFDFVHDLQQADSLQLDPALTNLFYWVNINHDILYHYGFDEDAGNFQLNNYDRGGKGGDHLAVDGFDGAFRNNAIFIPAPDGETNRLETTLWSGSIFDAEVVIGSLESPVLALPAIESQFSPNNQMQNIGAVQGEAIYLHDGEGNGLACQINSIANASSVRGKVAIVDRGTCFFTQKAMAAQSLGAIALIVIQNEAANPFAMGGNDAAITIPAVMVSRSARQQLIELSQSKEVLSFWIDQRPPAGARAASFDNAVITHEYAHGLSSRLTGGKHTIECLLNQEQMSEGISDYIALMFTTDWTKVKSTDAIGIATYLTDDVDHGSGIRSHAYSRELLINPLTYEDLPILPVSHGVGTLWAAILWDMTWNMIEMDGIATDLYHGQAGNTNALKIVVEALKIQPCHPGFIDARDALLKAATLLEMDRYRFPIWRAFARRGVGIDADQRDHNNKFDGAAGFALPEEFQSLLDLFGLKVLNQSVEINWSMLQEFGSRKFIIERSVDDSKFVAISEQLGATISEQPTSYSQLDSDPLGNYTLYRYRLALEDVDGNITYLAEDSIRLIPTDDLAIYPNPAANQIAVFVGSNFPAVRSIKLLNVQGMLLDEKPLLIPGGHTAYYDIPNLPAGVYFLEAISQNRKVVRKLIIK